MATATNVGGVFRLYLKSEAPGYQVIEPANPGQVDQMMRGNPMSNPDLRLQSRRDQGHIHQARHPNYGTGKLAI
jgi:hypothetical protein